MQEKRNSSALAMDFIFFDSVDVTDFGLLSQIKLGSGSHLIIGNRPLGGWNILYWFVGS